MSAGAPTRIRLLRSFASSPVESPPASSGRIDGEVHRSPIAAVETSRDSRDRARPRAVRILPQLKIAAIIFVAVLLAPITIALLIASVKASR